MKPIHIFILSLIATIFVVPSSTAVEPGCEATMTATSGKPWRPDTCAPPGYTNHRIPSTVTLNSAETTKIRSLPGIPIANIDKYSEPIYFKDAADPMRPVTCVKYGCYGGNSAPVVGDEIVSAGNDGQLNIVDLAGRRTYELYEVVRDADGTAKVNADGSITAGSMSVVDLDGRGITTPAGGVLNITGAGVSRLFGIIRAPEIKAAATDPSTAINHALSLTLPTLVNCKGTFREPATKTDGQGTGSCIQEGARVQLAPGYDCTKLTTKFARAVCHAMRKFGGYVMDNNGSQTMAFYSQHRQSWPTGISDYAAVGVNSDYPQVNIPMSQLRVLADWNG